MPYKTLQLQKGGKLYLLLARENVVFWTLTINLKRYYLYGFRVINSERLALATSGSQCAFGFVRAVRQGQRIGWQFLRRAPRWL